MQISRHVSRRRTRSLFCSHFGFAAERGPIVAVPNLQTHAHTHTHSAATMSRKIWGLLQDGVSLSELLPHLAVVRACWSAIATILLWSGLAGQLLPPSCCGQGWLVSYCHYLAAATPGLPPPPATLIGSIILDPGLKSKASVAQSFCRAIVLGLNSQTWLWCCCLVVCVCHSTFRSVSALSCCFCFAAAGLVAAVCFAHLFLPCCYYQRVPCGGFTTKYWSSTTKYFCSTSLYWNETLQVSSRPCLEQSPTP